MFGCNFNPATEMIEAIDTWNMPPDERNNVGDDNQEDITLISGSREDGRISCW